jgi:hypothetical protein
MTNEQALIFGILLATVAMFLWDRWRRTRRKRSGSGPLNLGSYEKTWSGIAHGGVYALCHPGTVVTLAFWLRLLFYP